MINCIDCKYYSSNPYLRCAVNPMALGGCEMGEVGEPIPSNEPQLVNVTGYSPIAIATDHFPFSDYLIELYRSHASPPLTQNDVTRIMDNLSRAHLPYIQG